jgi:calcineurin-like phosphoesterase family protein
LARYRHTAGLELTDPVIAGPDDIFLIADLHLGHANIIRYCSRPFFVADVSEMDHVLVKNWNYTMTPENRVYFLGDLSYGTTLEETLQFRKKLKGRITFIKGNHDAYNLTSLHSETIEQEGIRFFLVHDPADAPVEFDGWVIHGHHHNNDLRHFPFIDFKTRRINVSAEVIGYIPVSLRELCALIRKGASAEGDDRILLRYPHAPG